MLKKIMLTLTMITGFVHSEENDKARMLALITGTAVVTGTTIYWSMRESNDIKIERVQDWLTYYSGNLHYDLLKITNLSDMQQFMNQSLKFKKETSIFCKGVHQSYREMDARYGSWVKPWNWTSKMKQAYKQIKELHDVVRMIEMMFTYQSLMSVYELNLDESVIVKKAQAICHGASSYPMMYCVKMIHDDLKFLQKGHFKVSCDIALIDFLEKILDLIVNSSAYLEERRLEEEMKLKEREARAQEAQVAAQMAQAKAQQERNRIEREKLEHEKNK